MKFKNYILNVGISLILSSCQYDPYAHKFTTEEPSDDDLIGIYVFDNQTVNFDLKEFRDSLTGKIVIPNIIIYKNKNFKAEYLPYFKGINHIYSGLLTIEGNWQKTTIGSVDDGIGKLKHHWGIYLERLPLDIQYAGLMNNKPPYSIIFEFGDPDSGEAMIFKKK